MIFYQSQTYVVNKRADIKYKPQVREAEILVTDIVHLVLPCQKSGDVMPNVACVWPSVLRFLELFGAHICQGGRVVTAHRAEGTPSVDVM